MLKTFQDKNPGVRIEDIPTAFNGPLNQITVATLGSNPSNIMVVNPVWMAQLDALGTLAPIRSLIDDAKMDAVVPHIQSVMNGGHVMTAAKAARRALTRR